MQNKEVIQFAIKKWCDELKKFRLNENLTLDEVGRRLAILDGKETPYSKQYISYIEDGDKNISLDVFFRYCTAVGAKPVLQLMNQKEF